MNWADGFWRYDVAEIARALAQLGASPDEARDAHGSSLLALAVKYADPGEPLQTVAMLDMLFRCGCQWRREPDGRNLIVYALERELQPPVVAALLAWFYRRRSQHYSSCGQLQAEDTDRCPHWADLDREALEWVCQHARGSDTLRLLDTVVASNSKRLELPLRALRAAIDSEDEQWAMAVARHALVERAVRAVDIPVAAELVRSGAAAPPALQWLLWCVESAIHAGLGVVSAHLDRLNHRVSGLASAYYVHVATDKSRQVGTSSESSSSSSSDSSLSDSAPSRAKKLSRSRSRRTGALFVAALARQFRRDVAWEHVRLLVMARHRAAGQRPCLCQSEHSGECERWGRAHPLLRMPGSVFALVLAFVPASAAVRETLEAFGRWSRWVPRRPRARKRSLKHCE